MVSTYQSAFKIPATHPWDLVVCDEAHHLQLQPRQGEEEEEDDDDEEEDDDEEDTALPIGYGQTISQPFIVALMTQALLSRPRSRVLEVGTGSGYQTAVLASLRPHVRRVFSIERLRDLSERAEQRLYAMGSRSVRFRYGDGYAGWPEEAPFDGILVTAAPPEVPEALLEQLDVGGRLVVPVGGDGVQELKVYDRTERGLNVETLEYVRFVPLVKGKR